MADLRNPKQAARAERRLVEWMAAETGVAGAENGEAGEWWRDYPAADDRRSDAGGARPAAQFTARGSVGGLLSPMGVAPGGMPSRPMRRAGANPRDAVVEALLANWRPAPGDPKSRALAEALAGRPAMAR